MTITPSVHDVQTYLLDSGWQRQPRTWRQATIWSHADGYEVLVPPRDDLADTDLRRWEILGVLAKREQRPPDKIAADISTPFDDIQLYRAVPEGLPDGYIPLDAGLRSLRGIRDMVAVAARMVIEGTPSPSGGSPQTISEVLQHVRLGPARTGSYIFTLRVPVTTEARAPDGMRSRGLRPVPSARSASGQAAL